MRWNGSHGFMYGYGKGRRIDDRLLQKGGLSGLRFMYGLVGDVAV
jgi:hypothetical protein